MVLISFAVRIAVLDLIEVIRTQQVLQALPGHFCGSAVDFSPAYSRLLSCNQLLTPETNFIADCPWRARHGSERG